MESSKFGVWLQPVPRASRPGHIPKIAATSASWTTIKEIDTDAAAQTGSVPTLIVAVEQGFPREQRIIDDELAAKFLPVGYRLLVKLTRIPILRDLMIKSSESQVAGFWSCMTCRPSNS